MNKLILVAAVGLAAFGSTAYAGTITVGGGLGDWGITDTGHGLVTNDSVGNAITGLSGDVQYWEEKGAIDPWGYVSPGYGGYAYDIQGLYFTYDADNLYFAAIVGMPPGGFNGGSWNGRTWARSATNNEFMGDLALDFGGDGSFEQGIETGGTPGGFAGAAALTAGGLYGVGSWTAAIDYPASTPVNMKTGALLSIGDLLYGELTPGLYYIESRINRPAGFSGELRIHLTQTCGNDVAELRATVAPVPEPASMLLLGTGLVGLAGVARRSRKR